MRKGITPVIAVILLLLITISLVGFAFVFLGRTTETAAESGEQQLEQQVSQIAARFVIDNVNKNRVYVRNLGTQVISKNTLGIFIDNERVDYNLSADIQSSGVEEIKLNFDNIGSGEHRIKISAGVVSDSISFTSDNMNEKIVYYDSRYPKAWVSNMDILRNYLVSRGFEEKNADALQTWMQSKVDTNTAANTVVVMTDGHSCPNTVCATRDTNALIRRYVNAGGRIVWMSTPCAYYQGQNTGALNPAWGVAGCQDIFGITIADLGADSPQTITAEGAKWGIIEMGGPGWTDITPSTVTSVLAQNPIANGKASFKNYDIAYPNSGLVIYSDILDGNDPEQQLSVYNLATYPYSY